MKDFKNKVAAITGAASGIGRALALELAGRGCHLALCDVNQEGLKEVVTAATARGVRVTSANVNVADRDAVHRWADQVVADHGKVNLIFNNAGVSVAGTVEGMDYSDIEWVMGINFWGVVHGTKAFLPYLRASGEGHVVNISSLFGLVAQPSQSAYNASKFAVRGYTESLRQELLLQRAPVGVTCVHPGGIRTNIARASRYTSSMARFTGQSEEQNKTAFEKLLRTPPEQAARVILRAIACGKWRVLIGKDARVTDRLQRLMPARYQSVMLAAIRRYTRRGRQ